MLIFFFLSLLAGTAVTATLSFPPRAPHSSTSGLIFLLALPSFALAAPVLSNDVLASNTTPGTGEDHHHKRNGTSTAESAQGRNRTDSGESHGAHNGTLAASESAGNGTSAEKHHHHHNCTSAATGAQPSTSGAALNLGNADAGTGNSSSHGHHHHNCSTESVAAVVTQTVSPLPLTSSSA